MNSTLRHDAAQGTLLIIALLLTTASAIGGGPLDRQRKAEQLAISSSTHPFAGIWKDHCDDAFGLAIAPAGDGLYSVSFCGPGGCFEPGTYRPNTRLVDDPAYRIIDNDTIDVQGDNGFTRYFRCAGKQAANSAAPRPPK